MPLVPATTPPQLEHTPGAYVVVTDETFDAGDFEVDYPADWRIVKTSIAADDHVQVVFVAPDDSAITLTQVDTAGVDTSSEQYLQLSNGIVIQVMIETSAKVEESFDRLAEQLITSVREG